MRAVYIKTGSSSPFIELVEAAVAALETAVGHYQIVHISKERSWALRAFIVYKAHCRWKDSPRTRPVGTADRGQITGFHERNLDLSEEITTHE